MFGFDDGNVCSWQILLQKSQKAQRLIFRQRTKQATIAEHFNDARYTRAATAMIAQIARIRPGRPVGGLHQTRDVTRWHV
jgi:hypothetical protein